MITLIVFLNCVLNDIARDQAPWWGKKENIGVKSDKYHILHIKDSMCLPHILLQLFTLTPIFFYYITPVHLLQFSSPSIPDILCHPPPPRASRGSAIHVFLVQLQKETAYIPPSCLLLRERRS